MGVSHVRTVSPPVRRNRGEGSVSKVAHDLRPSAWPWITAMFLVAVAIGLLLYGLDFYAIDPADRPMHEDYEELSATGTVGQGYGVVGTALFIANLLYLVRRRLAKLPLGSMRAWLNAHVVTGLTGSLLIVFHSAFQARSAVTMTTSLSLGLVVGTGLVGRWLVAISPRPDPRRLAEKLLALDELIPGSGELVREGLRDQPVTLLPASAGMIRAFATVPTWMIEARARRRLVRHAWLDVTRPFTLSREEEKLARQLSREAASLAAGEVRAATGAALLRSWRSIHRLFALLMVLCVVLHVGVAWFYGYRWIFSG